jgi:hypothetical protein
MTAVHVDSANAQACVPNIVSRGRRTRYAFGFVTLAIGVLAAAWLATTDIDRAWRLWLLLPFWAGATGIFQAQAHT